MEFTKNQHLTDGALARIGGSVGQDIKAPRKAQVDPNDLDYARDKVLNNVPQLVEDLIDEIVIEANYSDEDAWYRERGYVREELHEAIKRLM